jgi:cytochrome c-type biogenesis protein CcsB
MSFLAAANFGSSLDWASAANTICMMGVLSVCFSSVYRSRAAESGAGGANGEGALVGWRRIVCKLPLLFLYAAFGAMAISTRQRWIEVNHFPSQTMSEVLGMFNFAMLGSMILLHYALGLHRRSLRWSVLDDVLAGSAMVAVLVISLYRSGLPTAQRDLPPALQSYWFAPHLSSLMLGYVTLGLAAVICLIYFVMRFWSGVVRGGQSMSSQLLILVGLAIVPFAHIVTLPVLAVSGLVFFLMLRTGRLPSSDGLQKLERELDDVSFRAFAVGMPFLTTGLWMGSFWAQDAWANYWGWDSKENAALISWLIYVVYIHLRMLGGYRGAKAMSVLMGGALSIFVTFQLFGYMPDSQKSLHRYTDDGVLPQEGQQGPSPINAEASLPPEARATSGAANQEK